MASFQAHFISFALRQTLKRTLARANARYVRAVLEAVKFPPPADVVIEQEDLGGVAGERLEPRSGDVGAILFYLHGGGYVACSARTHRPITASFARRGFRVFAPNYRLAPEHLFPAAVDDSVAAYGVVAAASNKLPIVIAGDSAGGGLAVATMLQLRDKHEPLPVAAVLFSPFTDLTGAGNSRVSNDRCCAFFHGASFARATSLYMGEGDPRQPLASPVYADLTGFPPVLIHVGADETLLDDSTRLAARAKACGVTVELKIWPVVPHVWQIFQSVLPEGRQSLDEAAAFLRDRAAQARKASTPIATDAVLSNLPQPTRRPRTA